MLMKLCQRMKNALFSDSILQGMRMKQLNSQVKEGKIHLKPFPGTKANQSNQYAFPTFEEFDYDYALIYVDINDILRSKDMSEVKYLPKNDVNKKKLSKLQYW